MEKHEEILAEGTYIDKTFNKRMSLKEKGLYNLINCKLKLTSDGFTKLNLLDKKSIVCGCVFERCEA